MRIHYCSSPPLIRTVHLPAFVAGWLSGQMPETPELEDVIRDTNRVIQKYF